MILGVASQQKMEIPPVTDTERDNLRSRFLEPETRCGHFVSVDTKKLWKCMLDILEELLRICDRNGLRCFMMSGTMLGAIRHGGFIPWDDDLDVCLPRQDYAKLIRILPKELPEPLFAQTISSDDGYTAPFLKIRNSQTAAITPWFVQNHLVANLGVFVDVHALDGIPRSPFLQRSLTAATHALMGAAKVNAGCAEPAHGLPRRILRTLLAKGLGRKGVDRALATLPRFAPFGSTPKCGLSAPFFGYGNPPHRGIWPTEWFQHDMEVDFEYLRVKIPARADEILSLSYGDWHTPVKSGVSWHEWMKFDTERDYKTVLVEDFGYKPEEFEPGAKRISRPCVHSFCKTTKSKDLFH